MLGLPGSGKSSFIDEFLKQNSGYFVVSADNIRLNHPKYNPIEPESIQEECVKLAEQEIYKEALTGVDLIMDGGGINNNYTLRILLMLKSFGYKTKVVFIDTPVNVCIERNNNRIKNNERFVPSSAIIHKAYLLKTAIGNLEPACDEFITVSHFTNEYVFADLDGTLCEYQNLPIDNDGDVNFVGYEVFKNSRPVNNLIDKLSQLHDEKNRNIFILSASPNSICNKEKIQWVKKYCTWIEEEKMFFVGNKNFKHTFLKHLILKLKITPNQCTVIDDDHRILDLYNSIGVRAVHPSSFLANENNNF